MKKISYLTLIFLFLSLGTFAQNDEVIDVEVFSTLTIKGSFNVILNTGNPYLRLGDNVDSNIKVKNEDGILTITSEQGKDVLQDLYINSPGLENINLEIDGNLTVNKNALAFSTLNFNAKVKGYTKLALSGEIFVGNFNNCGKITMKGKVDKLYLNLMDSKTLNTKFLTAKAQFVTQEY